MFFMTLCFFLFGILVVIFFFLVVKNQRVNKEAGKTGALHDQASVRVAWKATKFWAKILVPIFIFIYISTGIA